MNAVNSRSRTFVTGKRWRALAGVLLLSMVLAGPPVQAATGTQGSGDAAAGLEQFLPHLPAAAATTTADLGAATARLRDAIAEGGVAPALREVMAQSGTVPAVPQLPVPTPIAHLPQLAGLPIGTGSAVAGLHAAVQEAARRLGALPADEVREAARVNLDDLQRTATRRASRRGAAGPSALPFPAPASPPPTVARAVAQVPAASLLLAAALDAYTPELIAAGASAGGRSSTTVEGCDLLDLVPHLCVASDADNLHAATYELTVDLGGDDHYTNTAGGAPFPVDDETFAPVSVVVDIAGNDQFSPQLSVGGTYLPEKLTCDEEGYCTPEWAGGLLVHGAGSGGPGGVGALLDVTGNDTYAAIAPVAADGPADTLPHEIAVVAQGSGWLGTGLLVDGGGSDSYAATVGEGPLVGVVAAQGAALTPACSAGVGETPEGEAASWSCAIPSLVGMLVDGGVGDDTYRIDAGAADAPRTIIDGGSQADYELWPLRIAMGQGAAHAGAALLADGGGTDRFSLAAASSGPQDPGDTTARGAGLVWGQGYGFTSPASLLTGVGNTTYEATLRGTGRTGWNVLHAQAFANAGGVGILDDLGRDDAYHASHHLDTVFSMAGATCCRGARRVHRPPQSTAAQASVELGGAALLHDAVGNDAYRYDESSTVAVTMAGDAYDRASLHVAAGIGGSRYGQGATKNVGVATLLDAAGTDVYRFAVTAKTLAQALPHDGVTPVVTAEDPTAPVIAQGAAEALPGAGALVDLSGHADSFETRVDLDVQTLPNPSGGFARLKELHYQGGGSTHAAGTFVALGTDASVFSSPSDPAGCTHTQAVHPYRPRGNGGDGVWAGCSQLSPEVGVAPGSRRWPAGSALSLTVAPAERDRYQQLDPGIGRTEVRAMVSDAGGTPVVGETVHFILTEEISDTAEVVNRWVLGEPGWWYVRATTDAEGVAVAQMPLGGTWRPKDFGVMAIFDGIPPAPDGGGLPPAYAYEPVPF
jgi:hypothetical protein